MNYKADLKYEVDYEEFEFYLEKANDVYVIGIISETPVQPNESFIRKRLGTLLIRIEANLRLKGITKIAAVVPEEDIHFYSTFFNMAGITTFLMCRFPPDNEFTDHYFISDSAEKDLKIYEKCSVVFNIYNPDTEDDIEATADNLENENIVYIEVKDIEDTQIEGGDPLSLVRVLKGENFKRRKNDPYSTFPDGSDRFTREPETFMSRMLEARPKDDAQEIRRVVTSSVENVPPQTVRTEAQKGLDYRDKYNRGGTAIGIAQARDLSNGKNVSEKTIRRMVAFFTRHEKNRVPPSKKKKPDGGPTNGWIAWLLWGGDSGYDWALSQLKKIEKEKESK